MHLETQTHSIPPSASLITVRDGFFTIPVRAPLLAEETERIFIFYFKG